MSRATCRLLLIFCAWIVLSGQTIIRCSSGDDDGTLLPPPNGNRPPVAADGFYQVSSSGTLVGFMRATDPDGDRLSYRVISGPSLGSLQDIDSSTGRFTYIPGSVGTDSFSFRANDGGRDSNTAVITITVVQASAVQIASNSANKSAQEAGSRQLAALAAMAIDPLDPDTLLIQWAPPADQVQRIGAQGSPIAAGPEARSRLSRAPGLTNFPQSLSPPEQTAVRFPHESLPDGRVLARAEDQFGIRGRLIVSAGAGLTRILQSQDAGISWRQLGPDLPGPANGASLLQDRQQPLRWAVALEIDRAWQVLSSGDGGASWRLLIQIPGADMRLVDCPQDTICLADGDGSQLWRVSREP